MRMFFLHKVILFCFPVRDVIFNSNTSIFSTRFVIKLVWMRVQEGARVFLRFLSTVHHSMFLPRA